jgi:hypothetical protein
MGTTPVLAQAASSITTLKANVVLFICPIRNRNKITRSQSSASIKSAG